MSRFAELSTRAAVLAAALGLSACASLSGPNAGPGRLPDPLVISGQLTHAERIALPPDTQVVVALSDGSAENAPVVAEQRYALGPRQVPVPFRLAVDRVGLAEERDYVLRAALLPGGSRAWVSAPLLIDAMAPAIEVGTLRLVAEQAMGFASSMRCGDRLIRVGFAGEQMHLQTDSQRFVLRQAVSASGARFVADGDPATEFWSKGDRATLTVRGERWPECGPADGGVSSKPSLRATGNEPGWLLQIADGTLRFETADGEVKVAGPMAAGASAMHPILDTPTGRLLAHVSSAICDDTMSGMPHPFTVSVEYLGKVYRGCGGEPAALLRGSDWAVTAIDGQPAVAGPQATLAFDEAGRVTGSTSCNRYFASYRLSGEGLGIDRAASTKRACAAPLMAQEQRFLAALSAVQRFEIAPDGALVLIAGDQPRIVAQRTAQAGR